MQSLIVGNWKMFKTVREAELFARRLVAELEIPPDREVVIAPAFPALYTVAAVLGGSAIKLAAQNVHDQVQGAFTGEVSAGMLIDAGCKYVIIGHSERRTFFGETDDIIRRKLSAALASGLRPILCIGETLAEREQGATLTVIAGQIKEGLKNINLGDIGSVSIAYEPVWAIGTGKTATPEQAQEVHAFIRSTMKDAYGKELAGKLRIIYGGSVNFGNIGKLMSEKDINGALVGGASLDIESFSEIVKYKEV
ncbi:MAG: triose-phosphate isomerase [Deltaproteobacteria bacterium]|nr:triose-phosphate isomerase [Deltaproteobacteria bacterium]